MSGAADEAQELMRWLSDNPVRDRPKRPLNAFMCFRRARYPALQEYYADVPARARQGRIARTLSREWHDSQSANPKWARQARRESKRYADAVADWPRIRAERERVLRRLAELATVKSSDTALVRESAGIIRAYQRRCKEQRVAKRGANAYVCFVQRQFGRAMGATTFPEHPTAEQWRRAVGHAGRTLGSWWRAMGPAERAPYERLAVADTLRKDAAAVRDYLELTGEQKTE